MAKMSVLSDHADEAKHIFYVTEKTRRDQYRVWYKYLR